MNNSVTKLFSCCLDNRVIAIDTNFKRFHEALKKVEPDCYSDRWYSVKFKELGSFSQTINDKEYYFQRLV